MREKIIGILVAMLMCCAAFVSAAGYQNVDSKDSIPPVARVDWEPGDDHKMHYPQLPDEDGWDVYATVGLAQYPDVVLADDWQCSESGPVTDIHFWGSWMNGFPGVIDAFEIAIYTDIPADPPNVPYSRPGALLWDRTFFAGEWTEVVVVSPTFQGWYNPTTGETLFDDHTEYYQYNIVDIADPFIQQEGEIYWLAISAVVLPEEEPQPLWGWKSSEDHWNDDACWSYVGDLNWVDLWEPSPPPITNSYWIEFDAMGIPVMAGGTDYYDDGASFNGWYYYENTGWWNIWFYDHPFDPERYKDIFINFEWYPTTEPYFIEVAINWATDAWIPGFPPPVPPLLPDEEDLYIYREYVPIIGPGPVEYFAQVLEYNPEWVSIDVMGQNVVIPQGIITHQCLGDQSLDLAFVITGDYAEEYDFGDAPDPTYETLLANDGARHAIVPGVHLGHVIDNEADGQPTGDALGDDLNPLMGIDDEDGVIFTSLSVAGSLVTTKIIASVPGYLNAWVDFNADGDWADAGEQIFTDAAVSAGVNYLSFAIPANAAIGTTYSRFRFDTAGGLTYTGLASDGEVEDYRVFILRPLENVKMHWAQLPDIDNTGMDIDMFWVPLGDDFLCTESGPILDIHFWGSFADDILPADGPDSLTFDVYIYSDLPADQNPNGPWSQPNEILWYKQFLPGEYSGYIVADNNPEDWYDPTTELWLDDNHLSCYQYDFYIDESDAFIQEEGTIYWLVIKDVQPAEPDYTFGWKTTQIDLRWNDDACWLVDPPFVWFPMVYPDGHEYQGTTLDLAFAITSGSGVLCGDANGDGVINISDAVFVINYVFIPGSPAPNPLCRADANGDGTINVSDAVYLINYVFIPGSPPPVPGCCTPPW